MKIVMSYLVRLKNGTNAWLAAGKEPPAGSTVLQERPMLMPDEGKILVHKRSGEESSGHWLKDDASDTWAENWEEIDEPKED